MAKLIFTPGKEFADTPKVVKATFVALSITGVLTIADAFLGGKLIGLYHGLSGWGIIVLAIILGYLFYDTGTTLIRNRKIAKDIGMVFSAALIGIGIWRVIDGIPVGIGSIVLGVILIVLLSSKGVRNFLAKNQ
jgi:hypothetical protein